MNNNQDPSPSDREQPRSHTPLFRRIPNILEPGSVPEDEEEYLILTGQHLDSASDEESLQSSGNYTDPDDPQARSEMPDENTNDSSSSYDLRDEASMNNAIPVERPDYSLLMNSNIEYIYSNVSNEVPIIMNEDSNPISSASDDSNMSIATMPTRNESEISEPPTKVRKIDSPQKNADIDGDTCPICLDTWDNSGDHKLVSLKCGHLFGAECVKRWLKAQPPKEGSCPTCKSKATLKDLRFIYAKRLVAADTSRITALEKQLDIMQAENSRTVMELQKTKIAHRACVLKLEVLRSTLLKSQINREPEKKAWRFALEKNLEMSKDGGCRVMTYNCRTSELYVSQKSSNNLFPGYGIRKVSCLDNKLGQFLHLHPKPIRDISYSPPRDLLLSVALDSCARIVDRGTPSLMVNVGFPVWCCTWNHSRTNEFYVGGVGGTVKTYDIRNLTEVLATFPSPADRSPVISLCSTAFGLLSCQLNKCFLWLLSEHRWGTQELPFNGPFMSMSYDNDSQRVLMSTRPNVNAHDRSQLIVSKLTENVSTGSVLVDLVDTYPVSAISTVMSRATWIKAPGASWAAAHSESDSTLYLNGLDGARTMSLPAAEPALDIYSAQMNDTHILAALSESRLRLYKAVATNY